MISRPLVGAIALFSSVTSFAQIITVNYAGSVTDLGSMLAGDSVVVGDTVVGSFTYDSNLSATSALSSFSISLGSSFTATASSGTFNVQNDQQNGSATLPADGLTLGSNFTSTGLNGHTTGYMQFGLRKQNVDGQLWYDTALPDLTDWANISLADLNAPDWHWMDFELTTSPFWDDQIRWDIDSFSVNPVSEPTMSILIGMGLVGLSLRKRKQKRTR
jgi:hypothetical protein